MVLSEVVVMKDGGSFESMSKGELVAELEKLYEPVSEVVRHSSDVVPILRSMLDNRMQEHFMVIYLDSDKRIIKKKVVFLGTLNRSLVHPREVFHFAVVNDIKKIIIGHNHPSGNIQPSLEDIEMTSKLQRAGAIIGIEIIDHVIVTATNYYSFHSTSRFHR